MIKYVLTEDGVQNRETTAFIPIDLKNADYQAYLEWVGEGNTPVSIQPDDDHVLDGDEWVFDIDRQKYRQLTVKQGQLKAKMLELFEFTFALFAILRVKGVVENADFSEELRQKAVAWKTLLDEMGLLE